MKLSSKLAITIATGLGGLLVVAAVGLRQIDRIHTTTVDVVDRYAPSSSALDDIRHDAMELKVIALEMIADHADKENLVTLDKEFDEAWNDLSGRLDDYHARLVIDALDQQHADRIDLIARRTAEHLSRVRQEIQGSRLDSALSVWHTSDWLMDQLYTALDQSEQYIHSLTSRHRAEADQARSAALAASLLTTGVVALLMAGMAWWAYRGVTGSITALQVRLDDIGHTLDLGQRVQHDDSSDEMRHATEAINRLLERAHGDYIDIVAKHDEAAHSARHDELTGLPNRGRAREILDEAIGHAERLQQKVALLFIDLDGFKAINDNHGHDAGDFVLQEVARKLRQAIRSGDTAARLGGDEFLVILVGLSDAQPAGDIAHKIINRLRATMDYQGRALNIGASVGIAVYPDHGDFSESIIQAADTAMYRVKREEKNGFRFYKADDA